MLISDASYLDASISANSEWLTVSDEKFVNFSDCDPKSWQVGKIWWRNSSAILRNSSAILRNSSAILKSSSFSPEIVKKLISIVLIASSCVELRPSKCSYVVYVRLIVWHCSSPLILAMILLLAQALESQLGFFAP